IVTSRKGEIRFCLTVVFRLSWFRNIVPFPGICCYISDLRPVVFTLSLLFFFAFLLFPFLCWIAIYRPVNGLTYFFRCFLFGFPQYGTLGCLFCTFPHFLEELGFCHKGTQQHSQREQMF